MLVKTVKELRNIIDYSRSVGFVPTMGYLHEGHLSLIKEAKKENAQVVVSIFVNPTQFAPNEDFGAYPRDIKRDYKMAMEAGADFVFNPEVEEMYSEKAMTYVSIEGPITQQLCGKSRPNHFKGVTTVVAMLFNIVKPTKAYFGQKDAQQAIIIKKMVKELHMDLKIVVCPIIRETDGLAMSSRNLYLNAEERKQALVLRQSLLEAEKLVAKGEKQVFIIKGKMIAIIQSAPLALIDYVEIVDEENLENIQRIEKTALAAVAVKFGKTRLIDNTFLIKE